MKVARHRVSTQRKCSNVLSAVVAGATLLFATGILSASVAGASSVVVSGAHLSESTVTPGGGTVVVTGTASLDGTCSLLISPAVAGSAASTPCDANWPVQFTLQLPGNTSAKPIVYKVKIGACASGACSSSAALTVTQWAFQVSFKPTPPTSATVVAASCASVSLCLVIDAAGSIFVAPVGKVATKTQGDFNLSNRHMQTVACASATYCVGANLDGDIFTWSGGNKVLISGGHNQMKDSVAVFATCSSATVCLIDWSGAQGSGGGGGGGGGWFGGGAGSLSGAHSVIFNVHAKSSTTFSTPGVATGFSCPRLVTSTLSSCAVIDDQGYVSVFNNAQWLARSLTSATLVAVSCATVLSCTAGDSNRTLINFTPAQLMKAKEKANQVKSVQVGSTGCFTAYLCLLSSNLGVQLAEWPQFDASTGLQSASRWASPEVIKNSMVIATVPGDSTGFRCFTSKHHYVGTVTIVK